MPEARDGDGPTPWLYVRCLLQGWVTTATLGMLIAVALGYSIRSALLPVVVITAIFTPFVILPSISQFGPTRGAADVRPTASVRLSDNYEDVFDRCVEAAAAVHGSTIVRADRSDGVIVAWVAPTWESFGERLRLRVIPETAAVEIRLSSRPRMPLTVADHGKNQRNLETVVGHLTDSAVRTIPDQGEPVPPPRLPLGVLAVGGAAFVLQLAFSFLFRRSATGHLWFAVANVGFLLVFFGSWLLAARHAHAGVKTRVVAVAGAVFSIAGQLVVLAK